MTDNVAITPGTGATIATDDVGGVQFQRVKLDIGGDGATSPVVAGNGLPVAVVGTVPVSGTFYQATQPVSGTVAVTGAYQATQPVSAASLPLPAGAALDASVTALSAKFGALGQAAMAASAPVVLASNQSAIPVTLTSTTVTGSVAVTGPLTDAQIRATALPVSGTVTANAGSGTMAVSGPLTDAQLRASVVPVSLTSTTVTGTVAVTDNAGSLTVDAPVGTPAFVRLSDGAAAITTLPVSLASLPALAAGTNNIGDVDVLTLPALPTGSNVIGAVTQSGTWNVGSITTLPALVAGSAIVGKVGIDQTTPGTTNKVSIGTDGTVAINTALPAGTNAIGKLAANTGVTIGAVEIAAAQTLGTVSTVTSVSQIGGTAVNAFPAGFQRVTDEPRQIFYDPFDAALDTTNRWTAPTSAGGGVAASVTAGVMTLGSGTTTNGYSYLTSQASFVPTVPAWLGNSWAISIESAVGNNAVRFWGHGIVGGTPSSTSPLGATGNGYGFELDIAGVLQAVVYANGTRTAVASLAALQPTDALSHRYICFYRTDRIYWYIDGLGAAQLAATSNFQGPQVQTLPLLALAVAHSSAPAASRVISCTGLAVWDTGKNSSTLSDGTYPWRKATVTATGSLHTNTAHIGANTVLTGNGVTGTGSQRVTIASDNTAFSVNATPPTLTKATQGATGYSTQDLKDAGRVIVNAATAIAGVTAVTTEALLSLNISRDGAATAGATTHAVTSGKRWRVTGMVCSIRSTSAAVLSGRVSLRMNPSGAATASSPIIATASMTQQAAALVEAGDTCVIMFPDGIEFSGTMQIGLSQVCSAITGVVYASLIGYEY